MTARNDTPRHDDATLEELLGAYALDACEPDETSAIEEMLARRPDLAAEASALSHAAAWVGATEALEPPAGMRGDLLRVARERRPEGDAAARAYAAAASRVEQAIATFDEADADEPTPNGLRARDLVAHVVAQESLLAQSLGTVVEPAITERGIEARTAEFVERYRDRPLDDLRSVFRRSVEAVSSWAGTPASHDTKVTWVGPEWDRDTALVISAFEKWIHRGDLRRVQGAEVEAPPAPELHSMASLAMSILPAELELIERARPGRVARVVLTGEGGGEWLVAMDGGPVADDVTPDVTLTADVVDWCLVVGERLEPDALVRSVDGDESLADDLVHAAPAFAML